MRLLLDTHVLLWWLADDAGLAEPARAAIADPENDAYVSAASAWEIAIKAHLGKVSMPNDLGEQLAANSFTPLPVQVTHALAAGEDELEPARALRAAHLSGRAPARVLDLAHYEFGNVLLRRLSLPADWVGRALAALRTTVGEPMPFDDAWAKLAAELGEAHSLTFYDACWAAAARHFGVPLISADRQLLDAGLAESPTAAATRLGLLT